jgi:predicted ATP-dependent endonuclease of OLD family
MLKRLKIAHYRGFYREQDIVFAIPDGNKPGSGLTLVVGPNNAGKTTLLECLLVSANTDQKKFEKSERHADSSPKITIESTDRTVVYTNVEGGSQVRQDGECSTLFEMIPSRRYWNSESNADWDMKTLQTQSAAHSLRNAGPLETAAVLKGINRDAKKKKELNDLLSSMIPNFSDWTIESDSGDFVEYRTATARHKVSFSGDGTISVFRICAHLVSDDKSRVLIIDEPELSLHPAAQKVLSRILSSSSKTQQIIVCTHSPHFANWEDFSNGAHFIRLNKSAEQECYASMLDNRKSYAEFISNNLYEWQKPQLLDYVAKEILFAEAILIVEGQQDVGVIRKWLRESNTQLNADIFGYGAAGYRNIRLFLQVAKDLGIRKAAALYDNGCDSAKESHEVQGQYPDYKILTLPTDDILDKFDSSKKLIIDGCFDRSGALKERWKKPFTDTMNSLVDYFKAAYL